MTLPKDKSTRYSLVLLLALVAIVIADFARAIISSGFMSMIGIVALFSCAPAMFILAHFLGNHDLKPVTRQRNRERFLQTNMTRSENSLEQ